MNHDQHEGDNSSCHHNKLQPRQEIGTAIQQDIRPDRTTQHGCGKDGVDDAGGGAMGVDKPGTNKCSNGRRECHRVVLVENTLHEAERQRGGHKPAAPSDVGGTDGAGARGGAGHP